MNTVEKESVFIELLDETGNPVMLWTLTNAWPTQIIVADLEPDTAEVAVEVLELDHEGLIIKNGS